jgi:hypothetical protein
MIEHPLNPVRAKQLLRSIVATGDLSYIRHAREQMEERKINEQDVENILNGGTVALSDIVGGVFRYRVSTPRMTVVLEFESETEVIIVTVWRTG